MFNYKIKSIIFLVLTGFLFLLNFSSCKATDLINTANTTDSEVLKLTQEIKDYQAKLDDLQKQQQAYDNSLKIKRQEINNLSNQISILNNTASKLQVEIQATELEINKTQLEKQQIQLNIKQTEQKISAQKSEVGEMLRNLDQQERQKNYLEVLVVKGDIGSFFKTINEFQTLENTLNTKLAALANLKKQLETQYDNSAEREQQLNKLADQMSGQNAKLADDKQAQIQLLSKTKGQEANFQKLLNEAKAEQAAINADIQNLEIQARKKLASHGQIPSDQGFIWPVSSRTISTYFHDPDYPYRNIMEHPAIDIAKTPQGTPVRAAESGYVARVKFDGNTSYAYILLVHNNGLSTVYGHISKPYIKEDDFVVQGEVIALSGGMPGGIGSGNLTTGPHLHFEIRNNGIPVDPLKYLP